MGADSEIYFSMINGTRGLKFVDFSDLDKFTIDFVVKIGENFKYLN